LVRFFIGANHLFRKLLSKDQLFSLGKTFTPVARENNGIGAPAFDKLRASINLVIAAILIAIATSYKLPLSTTYVAFMVAMGTSLADRAWGSDSAVFRVAGVLNVIGGWFLTAISAFTVGGVIVYLLYIGGVQVIAVIIFIILLLVGKNYIQHKKENKAIREEEIALIVESNSFQGVIEETGTTIEAVMGKSFDIFRFIIAGLSTNDIKSLEKARKKSNKLADEIEGLDNRLFYFIRNLEDSSIAASNFYIELLQYLHDLSEDLSYLSKISYNHLNNNHRKLKLAQIRELMFIETNLKNTFKEAREAFQQKQNIKEFQDVLLEKSKIFELIDDKINTQIERTRAEETSPRSTALYFNFLIRTKELITHKFELIDKYYTVVRKL
jgi:phosphate/sulfate permease